MEVMLNKDKEFTSISKQLLKVVFTFYFSITIIMTLVHFIIEYFHTQDSIKSELNMISKTFESSLETAIWNFDTNQIESISLGIIKLPTVLGIEVYDKNSKENFYTKYNKGFKKDESGVFSYKLDIFHLTKNKNLIYTGTIKYYSSSDIVFERVKLNFFIIFLNSLLKSILLTILFIWAFRKYLTIPLDKITQNIHNINLDKINLHKPIDVDNKTNNELTFLSIAFNKMLFNLDEQLTKLQDAQKHLVQSEKMVSLGNMVAGVAHEINTPIGMALTGITHLDDETKRIKRLYESEEMSEEDFKHYLEDNTEINNSIQINIKKSVALIKSFKMVAVDQSSDESRTINFKDYINEILLSLRNKLKMTKINIKIECQDDLVIITNAGAISQILTNLIMNSLIHGFKKDDVGTILIGAVLVDHNLELTYKDTGIGISKEVKERIFDPFFTTKRGDGGSGLGTSIIYNLVTVGLNGTIVVQSELNHGITFGIVIPIKSKGKLS
jgi:signal transduction histidine kinase